MVIDMKYVLFDRQGNVKTFKSETKLDEYLKKHEGIFYLVGVNGKWINVSEIKAEKGDYQRIAEKSIEFEE